MKPKPRAPQTVAREIDMGTVAWQNVDPDVMPMTDKTDYTTMLKRCDHVVRLIQAAAETPAAVRDGCALLLDLMAARAYTVTVTLPKPAKGKRA